MVHVIALCSKGRWEPIDPCNQEPGEQFAPEADVSTLTFH